MLPSGEYVDQAATLGQLIAFAYPDEYKVAGLPGWARACYQIDAKPASRVATAEVRRMMQNLLASRFHLTFHVETTNGPVDFLILGKNGLTKQFAPAKANERPSPPFFIFEWTRAVVFAKAVTMNEFAGAIARNFLHRPVIDHTGLTGRYSVNIPPFVDQAPARGVLRPSTGDELRDLLKKQLGLDLQPGTGPVSVMVIDRVERPTPN